MRYIHKVVNTQRPAQVIRLFGLIIYAPPPQIACHEAGIDAARRLCRRRLRPIVVHHCRPRHTLSANIPVLAYTPAALPIDPALSSRPTVIRLVVVDDAAVLHDQGKSMTTIPSISSLFTSRSARPLGGWTRSSAGTTRYKWRYRYSAGVRRTIPSSSANWARARPRSPRGSPSGSILATCPTR
jgi:hypothetical protein